MNDEPALLAAIITQPAEDTPRLAYADFLDERSGPGDAHFAAYIRCNVALARGDEATNRAQRELIERNGWTWRGSPHAFGQRFPGLKFRKRRGFIERVECDAIQWLAVEERICWHPRQGRPCPLAAQPVREVDLVPLVDDRERRDRIYALWQERRGIPPVGEALPFGLLLSTVLADLWPGVSFDWPGQVKRAVPITREAIVNDSGILCRMAMNSTPITDPRAIVKPATE